jgi:hypothetical protein
LSYSLQSIDDSIGYLDENGTGKEGKWEWEWEWEWKRKK